MKRCRGCGAVFWDRDESGFVVYPAYSAESDRCTRCAIDDRRQASRRYDEWFTRYKSTGK